MSKSCPLPLLNVVAVTVLLYFAQTLCAQQYAIEDLGTLGVWSRANGINDFGDVVGESLRADGQVHAFKWTSSRRMVDLDEFSDYAHSVAADINNSGTIIGELGRAADPWYNYHAFLYQGVSLLDLNTLGGSFSTARGINDAGTITGGAWVSGNSPSPGRCPARS